MLRWFITANAWLCRAFDRLLPARFRVDGNRDFLDNFVPAWLGAGVKLVDVGGGKTPYLSVERKGTLHAHVTGLDIDARELEQAPAGAYDEVVCADIAAYAGHGDADLCICQAMLEHVPDTQ